MLGQHLDDFILLQVLADRVIEVEALLSKSSLKLRISLGRKQLLDLLDLLGADGCDVFSPVLPLLARAQSFNDGRLNRLLNLDSFVPIEQRQWLRRSWINSRRR